MSSFKSTRFEDLSVGMLVKHPARGKDAKVGEVIYTQSDKQETSILVRWVDGDGTVFSAVQPHSAEIHAKEQ